MARKRQQRSPLVRPYLRLPIAELISIERAVEEALLIARSALTMEVKNRIIVSTLRDDHRFDPIETASWVGIELMNLSVEQATYATRMDVLAEEVSTSRGRVGRDHDYGPRDFRLLTRRGLAYASLSRELAHLVDDARFIECVVEDARGQAWSELGTAIESRLVQAPNYQPDDDYVVDRDTRIEAFLAIDLARLQLSNGDIPPN